MDTINSKLSQQQQQQDMWLPCILLLLPVLLVLLRRSIGGRKEKHGRKLPPGPPKFPIIGNLHLIGPKPHISLWKLSQKYGPLMSIQLGSIPAVVISSDDMVREVFTSHDIDFSNRPHVYAVRKLSYGATDLIAASYGERWRELRKVAMMELFSAKRVETFRAKREAEVGRLVSYIRSASSSSPPTVIDFHRMMVALLNDFISQIMFGDRYKGGLNNYEEGGSKFHEVVEAISVLGGFSVADYFPSLKWIDAFTGQKQRVERAFHKLDRFYDEMIQAHIDSAADPGHEDLVDVLLQLQKDPNHRSVFGHNNTIKGIITNFFVAGSDSASATLAWAMTQIVRNPRVMKKVQEELRNVVGNRNKVDEDDLQQLHYLKLVIKETLRTTTPLPLLLPRETTEACTIQGWEIPAETRVFINTKAISMDPSRWTNPDEFLPERFLENPRGYLPGPHYDFLPFGIGRRICPGPNLAMSVIELTLANLLHCFDWELPNGMKPEEMDVEEIFGLSLRKKNHLCLVAKPRSSHRKNVLA